MASKAKTEGETNTELANMKDRQEAITAGFDEIYRIDRDIEDAKEKHIAHLTKARTKLWRKLKADTGITQEDMKPYYSIHKRNKLAVELGGEDCDRIHDALREIFFAMQKGGQMNFLDAMQDAA